MTFRNDLILTSRYVKKQSLIDNCSTYSNVINIWDRIKCTYKTIFVCHNSPKLLTDLTNMLQTFIECTYK